MQESKYPRCQGLSSSSQWEREGDRKKRDPGSGVGIEPATSVRKHNWDAATIEPQDVLTELFNIHVMKF